MDSQFSIATKLLDSGKTQLDRCFVSAPFKLLTLPSKNKRLQAVQMSSSPGLLANDRVKIEINLAEYTDLQLSTQAFTRIQSMQTGQWAEQNQRFYLAKGSHFCYLPHPTVLHKDSAFRQNTHIEMAESSRLMYGDIVAIGRVGNQERFAFRQFSSFLGIYHQQKPLLLDRLHWQPQHHNLTALSQMEDFSHHGMLVYINLQKEAKELKNVLITLQQKYQQKHPLIGISLLEYGGFSLRAVAHRSDLLEKVFSEVAEYLYSVDYSG